MRVGAGTKEQGSGDDVVRHVIKILFFARFVKYLCSPTSLLGMGGFLISRL